MYRSKRLIKPQEDKYKTKPHLGVAVVRVWARCCRFLVSN